MNVILGMLSRLPKNMTAPVLFLLAGWYGGAKYGAPDYVMSSIDGLVEQASTMAGGLLNKDDEPAGDSAPES